MQNKQILFCGPSGVGKTTLAKAIAKELGIEFVSSSLSEIAPETMHVTHYDMLDKEARKSHSRNISYLNLRKKLFLTITYPFVSDRSYLDIAAYEIIRAAKGEPTCDTSDVLEFVNEANSSSSITHIIFVPFTHSMFYQWVIEDNHKRITNTYFQTLVSKAFEIVLDKIGVKFGFFQMFKKNPTGKLLIHGNRYNMLAKDSWLIEDGNGEGVVRSIPFLVLNDIDMDKRMKSIRKFLK